MMALDTTLSGTAADSYGTLAAFQTYASDLNWDISSYTDAVQESNLRRATQYLDRTYTWKGYRVAETQALDWPREVTDLDDDGFTIPSDSIPAAIVEAEFEVAFAMLGGADPYATTTTGAVKRQKVKAGPVESETEYTASTTLPGFPALTGLLREYISGTSGGNQRRVVRA